MDALKKSNKALPNAGDRVRWKAKRSEVFDPLFNHWSDFDRIVFHETAKIFTTALFFFF
jgi:hypothetical protein